jgi:hypothetical protein
MINDNILVWLSIFLLMASGFILGMLCFGLVHDYRLKKKMKCSQYNNCLNYSPKSYMCNKDNGFWGNKYKADKCFKVKPNSVTTS